MSKHIIFNLVGSDIKLHVSEHKIGVVKHILDPFLLSDGTISKINSTLDEEINLGLKMKPERPSSLQMANTFIPKHLEGDEKGEFLALDLGGTNFRVILLRLDPAKDLESIVKYYTLTDEVRLGEGELLFDFLAVCISDFLKENNLMKSRIPLGFCFSFPMIQTGIDEGILVTWTKTFKCKNVVGKEVVQMLRKAIDKQKDINVEVVAVINDTTGTLMMGSYLDKKTAIGLILGTGCNAAYFEKVKNIEKWKGEHRGIDEVIIDIEWGAFGDNGVLDFMKTKYDNFVDENSLFVKSFTFEKLFAGRFVGDLVKYILLELIEKKVLFENDDLKCDKWKFTASDVSCILEEDCQQTLERMKNKGFTHASTEDIEIVHYVCTVVSIRGSLVVSICLANLLRRMDKDYVTIAIDGSLFKCHPKYKEYMELFITHLAPKRNFKLILAEDGSGKGAGLVAAVVKSLDKTDLHA